MAFITCPECNESFSVNNESSGTNIQCPKCQSVFEMSIQNKIDFNDKVQDGTNMWLVCPHCWKRFERTQINYISRHIDLIGDPVLGEDAQTRFLPINFSPQGLAIDAKGLECPEMACPYCHLKIPDSLLQLPCSFFSIVGTPSSGKSYFLSTMLWQIRKFLPKYLEFNLADADSSFNSVVNNYEMLLFQSKDPSQLVALPKTELQGSDYSNQVLLDGVSVDLPRPFVFVLSPMPAHPKYKTHLKSLQRNIVLYDNAGEHFEPGRESSNNLATIHLAHSDGIMFLYDPLRDARMLGSCSSTDPQYKMESANQLALFHEMTSRIRKFTGMQAAEKFRQPLIMMVGKFDAVKDSFGIDVKNDDFLHYDSEKLEYQIDLETITNVSFQLREKMLEIAPDIVGAAEAFSDTVYFVPCSAFGKAPEIIEDKSQQSGTTKKILGIRPYEIKPLWTEVPFLLHLLLHGFLTPAQRSITDYEEITQYRFIENSVIFSIPGIKRRFELPGVYWGHCIFCKENNKYYLVPSQERQEIKHNNIAASLDEQIDVDFWDSL